MANRWSVTPAGDMSQGLSGLGAILNHAMEQKKTREAEETARAAEAEAQTALMDAYNSGDPNAVAEAAIQYPWIAEQANAARGLIQDYQKQEATDFASEVLTNPERAAEIAERRIAILQSQGRDPKDTARFYEMYQQDPQGAMRALEMNFAGINPEVYKAYRETQVDANTKVIGDFLVDTKTGEVIFDGSGGGNGSPEFGLTPMVYRDPQTGAYQPFLPNKAGGMQALQAPNGLEFVPDAARMGYNPTNIAERGAAEAATALQNAPVMGQATAQQSLAETQGQRASALGTKEDQFKLLDDVINEVRNQSGFSTTGFVGEQMKKIPGTAARDMAANLDTLQAAAGFEKLQEMRNNSPTGGALGSVTERELALLQATWGSLQQSQSQEQFEKNLDRFQKQVKDSWDRVEQAYQRDYGQSMYGLVAPQNNPPIQGGIVPGNGQSAPMMNQVPAQGRRRYNPATGMIE